MPQMAPSNWFFLGILVMLVYYLIMLNIYYLPQIFIVKMKTNKSVQHGFWFTI